MGVMFQTQDDVAELLVPFIQRIDPKITSSSIETAYLDASLGGLSADEFWTSLGMDPCVEEDYLASHSLNHGLRSFLRFARGSDIELWCLSNDVSRWSLRLRQKFGLERYFSIFVISGDIGIRKPNEGAYLELIQRAGTAPENILFVDDRRKNVLAARAVGLRSIIFDSRNELRGEVSSFAELSDIVACALASGNFQIPDS